MNTAFPKLPDSFRQQTRELFARMDAAFEVAAEAGGFVCNGCEESCCATLFFHHTLLEALYLREGFFTLDTQDRALARQAAGHAIIALEQYRPGAFRAMCPVNRDGRCIIYAYRPMICRLHGVPYSLTRPGGKSFTSQGCPLYHGRPGAAVPPLDRTPLYHDMALLESELRRRTGFAVKVRMTVADMIESFCHDEN